MAPRPLARDANVLRAAKLSRVPGVTLADVCERFDVSKSSIQKVRRESPPGSELSLAELALAALSKNGKRKSGTLSGLAQIAGWIDYVNHDGCSADDVRALLDTFVASGHLSIEGGRWKLREAWPWLDQAERPPRG